MKCPLCGCECGEREEAAACKGCPLALGDACSLARCPRCGYSFPRESRLLKKLRGWKSGWK
ncbi:hypothetical protein [Candidatus Hecatella orcuttiae]|uniref:hypothetical protein n=1 Tax=Candidatus Hecatella orcuttiae TaxID=1935119 RepID=UPI002867C3B6|nr:hypothetical protein [Candidatus Hecatella orcuttiae]